MIEKNGSAGSLTELKKLFQNPKNAYKPYIYLPLDGKNELSTPEKLTKLINGYKKSGFGGIIPFSYKNYSVQPMSEEYYEIYRHINKEAKANALSVGYLDDTYLMREYIGRFGDARDAVGCNVLVKYEYACTEGQSLKRRLRSPDDLMALVAVNDDDLTILDLRSFIADEDTLEWTVPDGNWNIEEYVCEPDPEYHYIDMMDYDICAEYLKRTFHELLERLGGMKGDCAPIDVFIYRNILYAGRNRRMWHRDFNKVFEEHFGIDPAPYYPLLFRDFGGYAKRYRSMLMPVEDVFSISGRGTVATGRVERGVIKMNEPVEIVGIRETKATVVTGIEMFHKLMDYAEAGDNIGALLRGVQKNEIERGQVLCKPGSVNPHTKFVGQVYVLTEKEGGRQKPFFSGYRPQFYFRTTDVTGVITLPEGVDMCRPGDNVTMTVELITPIACEEKLRFAIREGGRTVGSGAVVEIID